MMNFSKWCIRKIIFCLPALFLISGTLPAAEKKQNNQSENKMMERKLLTNADPFILCHNGVYYSYGTNHKDGVRVYGSRDLRTWKLVNNGRESFALRKEDIWGDKWFWAPEVYSVNGRFIIYLTSDYHISCAESSSPTGPFVQKEKKPMSPMERRIDNHLFIDDDGKGYCFFSRCLDTFGGSAIWAVEVENDYMTTKEDTLFRCLGRTEPWEMVQNAIVEGPFVIKHGGKYYLTYSANDYKSHDYAVGYAVADNVKGPYVKIEKSPILHRPAGMVGAGHHSFFTDKEGKLRIVFHVHKNETEIHPRYVVIGDVFFEDGKMRIGKEFIIPEVLSE